MTITAVYAIQDGTKQLSVSGYDAATGTVPEYDGLYNYVEKHFASEEEQKLWEDDFRANNIDRCSIDRNNQFVLEITDKKQLKKLSLRSIYNEVIDRENRSGLPFVFVKFGDLWIKGRISCSNLGYDFRGQLNTKNTEIDGLYPEIHQNYNFHELLLGK